MNEFEINLSIQKLKVENNILDTKSQLGNLGILHPDYEKTEALLWELKAYLTGIEFVQELYYKSETGEKK